MLSTVATTSQPIPLTVAGLAGSGFRTAGSSSGSADTFERSAFSDMFEQLGLAPSSRLDTTRDRIDFTFSFTSSTKETLSASGFVAQREQHASLTLNYTFQRVVVVDGRRELKSFTASIAFEADTSNSLSVKPFKKKEDILHFLSRLMDDVISLLRDDSVVLTGISLDQEDVAELMNLDKGKVKKLFDGLIAAIMTMAFLKRMKRGNEAGPNVVLAGQRGVTEGIQEDKESRREFSLSVTISEETAKENHSDPRTASHADRNDGIVISSPDSVQTSPSSGA